MKTLIKILCLSVLWVSCESSTEPEADVYGCTDDTACNYDENATDAGECTYAESFYDCDGNCVVDVDCFGVCGGFSEDLGCGCGEPAAEFNLDCDGNEINCDQLSNDNCNENNDFCYSNGESCFHTCDVECSDILLEEDCISSPDNNVEFITLASDRVVGFIS